MPTGAPATATNNNAPALGSGTTGWVKFVPEVELKLYGTGTPWAVITGEKLPQVAVWLRSE